MLKGILVFDLGGGGSKSRDILEVCFFFNLKCSINVDKCHVMMRYDTMININKVYNRDQEVTIE